MGLISRVSSRTYRKETNHMQKFGQHTIKKSSQVFYETNLSFACVNISPQVPGHVLVCPKREVARYKELSIPEVQDLAVSCQLISKTFESHFKTEATTVSMQDGAAAGQSVAHVHWHVLPRKEGDFERNDDIYAKLQADGTEVRVKRTEDEMQAECEVFRGLF